MNFKQGTHVNLNAFQVTTSWSWLRECQECAKPSSRQRVATLKNLKYKIYFDLFNTFLVIPWFHVRYFIFLKSLLLFYNVENSKNKEFEFEWFNCRELTWRLYNDLRTCIRNCFILMCLSLENSLVTYSTHCTSQHFKKQPPTHYPHTQREREREREFSSSIKAAIARLHPVELMRETISELHFN